MLITLTTMSNGPDAIGRDPETGRAVFVPFAIPGETVRVEIVEEKSTFARARLLEVITPSPDRAAPVCRHFGPDGCGGCHYQHMSYAAQLKWKRQIVVDQLVRIGGVESPNVLETIPSPDPLHYRNHVQFSQASDGKLGFVRAGLSASPETGEHGGSPQRNIPTAVRAGLSASPETGEHGGSPQRIIPIAECPIARPEIMELFGQIEIERLDVDRIGVRAGSDGEPMLVFESESGDPPDVELDLPISVAAVNRDGEAFTMIGSDHIVQEINGRPFRVSPGSFFQVNTAQAENLVGVVIDALGLRGGETVLDLYCGVGLFSAFVAPLAARVIGVESFSPAVRDAEANLDEFDNVELYESSVEMALAHLAASLSHTPTRPYVLLDPPRSGCDKSLISSLIQLAAPRIVYVSCDPATLARDARRLIAGGCRLVSAQPLDMFPQTHHVETVAVFER